MERKSISVLLYLHSNDDMALEFGFFFVNQRLDLQLVAQGSGIPRQVRTAFRDTPLLSKLLNHNHIISLSISHFFYSYLISFVSER